MLQVLWEYHDLDESPQSREIMNRARDELDGYEINEKKIRLYIKVFLFFFVYSVCAETTKH